MNARLGTIMQIMEGNNSPPLVVRFIARQEMDTRIKELFKEYLEWLFDSCHYYKILVFTQRQNLLMRNLILEGTPYETLAERFYDIMLPNLVFLSLEVMTYADTFMLYEIFEQILG
jgi:hypothetical protein